MDYVNILIKIRKIIRSINLESKRVERNHGISIPQLLTLQYLSIQNEYKSTSSKIKDYLNLNASTISGIIKRLEDKGLVARLPNNKDRRVSYITLTAKGADLIQTSPTTLQEKLQKRLSKLNASEIKELEKNINLLTDLMDASEIDAAPIVTNADLLKI